MSYQQMRYKVPMLFCSVFLLLAVIPTSPQAMRTNHTISKHSLNKREKQAHQGGENVSYGVREAASNARRAVSYAAENVNSSVKYAAGSACTAIAKHSH